MKRKLTVMEVRAAECMFLLMLMFLTAALRIVTVVGVEDYSAAAANQTAYKLNVSRQRGTIFDTNMRSLTNAKTKIVAAVVPNSRAVANISEYLYDETEEELIRRLSAGKPVLVTLSEYVECDGVVCITVLENSNEDTLAPHLIGYTDGSGHGVSGIQAAFDDVLYSGSNVSFSYTSDAQGNVINNFNVQIVKDVSVEAGGVKTTLDTEIQAAVEEAAADMKSGAVIVSEVGSGKIRALASYPSFDISNVSHYLNAENSPLVNRAFSAYNVGSVFKPCVAAAALEQGIYENMLYECLGSKLIEEKLFACHKADGHGLMSLKDAISQSCNTYFYTLANRIGAESIYNMASSLGFGQRYTFAEGLYTEQGNLPSYGEVSKSEQSVANLSIGQGELMLTPVSLLTLYEAIANNGIYYRPTLIEGIVKNGVVVKEYEQSYPTRVMSEETSSFLKQALFEVVIDGTGTAAKPTSCTAAGKTATAQTGWKIEGAAVDHSWFCGFFPAEHPKYTVVIISENTSGGGTPCAPVFSSIADAVYSIKLS